MELHRTIEDCIRELPNVAPHGGGNDRMKQILETALPMCSLLAEASSIRCLRMDTAAALKTHLNENVAIHSVT